MDLKKIRNLLATGVKVNILALFFCPSYNFSSTIIGIDFLAHSYHVCVKLLNIHPHVIAVDVLTRVIRPL